MLAIKRISASDYDSVKKTMAQVLDTFGRIDILVNNAGGSGRGIPPEMRKNMAMEALFKSTGFGRFGEPDDIANMTAFLASEDAKFITGQNYAICGLMNLGIIDSMHGD